ncbi:DJ-1/PfpI family protein [Megasphaera cerevisiae]|uniref:DJ-1/PfpI family protein n=1 Tax=Megasphaera cerevisiae TaxID=39029 RepID=UPI00099A6E41|nr:DJ-1/PfpI family protein [Megasphaera cerevisiae]MCI1750208.1 DJ-1/PfpI family protein [Megasphaera cerevisiae]SKA18108.1 Transcriptional regulator containing an amidase domain and an AraC-type DNA-binding HTH domain [Megasphaera cerevisiae DSM 20462]
MNSTQSHVIAGISDECLSVYFRGKKEQHVNLFLFEGFETLDIFGPVEILGQIQTYTLHYYSLTGGIVANAQGVQVVTEPIEQANPYGILVIPGGMGTRRLVDDKEAIRIIGKIAVSAAFCLSICTGSAVLGKAGVLDGKQATSNKQALGWVKSIAKQVIWIEKARWVVDGKFYTSSGVSAGMDMTLGFIKDRFGEIKAQDIANHIEYIWNTDSTEDRFAEI